MYMLEAMETEILNHLYEKGIVGINGGWEKQSELDYNAAEELYREKLVDKSTTKGFIRLSARGVGAVLLGIQNADKIFELL
jgi:ribose 5-phosphate isomerase RpiB